MDEKEKIKRTIIISGVIVLILGGILAALLLLRGCSTNADVSDEENELILPDISRDPSNNSQADESTDGTDGTEATDDTSALSVTPVDLPDPDSQSGFDKVNDNEPDYTVFDPLPSNTGTGTVIYYGDYDDEWAYYDDSWIYAGSGSSSGSSSSGGSTGYSGTTGSGSSSAGGGGSSIGGGTSAGGGPGSGSVISSN